MLYAPQQVMEVVGISQQTFRYWRRVLAPLNARQGHTRTFSFADLLALKVVKNLVDDCGITISALEPLADELFKVCRLRMPPETLKKMALVICPGQRSASIVTLGDRRIGPRTEVAVPLAACVEELLSALQEIGEVDPQIELRLPPTPVLPRTA